jgi:hypothetical protein
VVQPDPACASDVTTLGMVEPKTEEFSFDVPHQGGRNAARPLLTRGQQSRPVPFLFINYIVNG